MMATEITSGSASSDAELSSALFPEDDCSAAHHEKWMCLLICHVCRDADGSQSSSFLTSQAHHLFHVTV